MNESPSERATTDAQIRQHPAFTVGILTDDEIRAISDRLTNASTRPWKVDTAFDGENWLVASFGNSGVDGLDYHVTTDHVHASEYEGDAKTDAEFTVWCRNDMGRIGRAYIALREVATDLYAACRAAKLAIAPHLTDTDDFDAVFVQLQNALLKARGGEEMPQ